MHRTDSTELTTEELKKEIKLTDQQLDTKIEEHDLPEVSACFDNTDDYLEKLELLPGQQTDVSEVKSKTTLNRTQAGMKLALKYWLIKYPLYKPPSELCYSSYSPCAKETLLLQCASICLEKVSYGLMCVEV